MGIRELFRQRLENAEIIPDPSVKSKLMRKLAIREFLHFSASHFNIYYLGIVLVTGITSALLLLPPDINTGKIADRATRNDSGNTVIAEEVLKNAGAQIPVQPAVISAENLSGSKKVRTDLPAEKVITHESLKKNESREKAFVPRTEVKNQLSENTVSYQSSTDKNKLRPAVKSGEVILESSVESGCTPLKVWFYNKASVYDSCRWTFGDGGSSDKKDTQWIFDVDGEYKVILEVFGPDGSKTSFSKIITVYPKPVARFEISPEKAILPDDEIRFMNYSSDGVKYSWDFGDGSTSELFEPVHRYSKFANFNIELVVTSGNGCSDSLKVLNAFSGSQYYITFPNAFIPNPQGPAGGFYSSKSDERAEVFHPASTGVSEFHLKIFSKLGILIFESSDINIGWDGYFKGQLCEPGVYIWKVRGNFRNGEPFTKMGDVTILKN